VKGRARTALGIDIGADRVSLTLVAREADGYRVVRTACRSIAHGGSSSDGLADTAAFARALRKLRRQAGIPRMKAVMGVSASPLVLQMLDTPRQMPQNVREFVENELGQYVTLSSKAIVCDFCTVPSGRDLHRQLLSVAGETEVVSRLARACEHAGLIVEAVEPSILAYARARCRQQEMGPCAGKVLIVEINASQLRACLLRGGVLEFVRTRSAPAEAQTSTAANEWLVKEIEAMIRHCDSESGEGDAGWAVDVLVRDGAGVTQEVTESLRARTGVPARVIADSDDPHPAVDSRQAHSLVSTIALGLAMKRLDAPGDAWKINLLPREIVRARSLARHVLTVANAAAIVFLCMVLSILLVTRTAHRKQRDLYHQRVTQGLYTTPALRAQTRSVDRQIAWIEHQLNGIGKALDGHSPNDWSALFNAIAANLPTDVCITRLWSPETQRLCIQGLAMSSGAVHGFVQSLGRGGSFESVSLESLNRPPGGDSLVEYEMYCLMKATP
jgi:Tfp pilus assembly protein PilN